MRRAGAAITVGFVTDVEGNLRYFEDYVCRSRVLQYSEPGVLELLHPYSYFVYGGDLFDKGSGDIRLANQLVALKQRYPTRVFLIMGNRDVNKLRFMAELHPSEMKWIPAAGPFWVNTPVSVADYLRSKGKENTRTNRLQYMLEETLGCPKTFEFRREELALLGSQTREQISDDEVTQSFVDGLDSAKEGGSNGCYIKYLRSACLGVCIGDTLFVHGGLPRTSLGFVPPLGKGSTVVTHAAYTTLMMTAVRHPVRPRTKYR
jgi:hypothetical protein